MNRLNSRIEKTEKRISERKDRTVEIFQFEQQRKWSIKKWTEPQKPVDCNKKNLNISVTRGVH